MGEQLLFKHPELGKVAPLCGAVDILLSCLIIAGSIGRSEALRCSARSWHTVGLQYGQEDGLSAAGHVGLAASRLYQLWGIPSFWGCVQFSVISNPANQPLPHLWGDVSCGEQRERAVSGSEAGWLVGTQFTTHFTFSFSSCIKTFKKKTLKISNIYSCNYFRKHLTLAGKGEAVGIP